MWWENSRWGTLSRKRVSSKGLKLRRWTSSSQLASNPWPSSYKIINPWPWNSKSNPSSPPSDTARQGTQSAPFNPTKSPCSRDSKKQRIRGNHVSTWTTNNWMPRGWRSSTCNWPWMISNSRTMSSQSITSMWKGYWCRQSSTLRHLSSSCRSIWGRAKGRIHRREGSDLTY